MWFIYHKDSSIVLGITESEPELDNEALQKTKDPIIAFSTRYPYYDKTTQTVRNSTPEELQPLYDTGWI